MRVKRRARSTTRPAAPHPNPGSPDRRSPAEWAIWPLLEPMGFRCQYQRLGYILDFYHPQAKLAVEIDGRWHDARKDYDLERDTRFAEIDILTLRVPAADALYRTEQAAERIRATLETARRRHKPGPAAPAKRSVEGPSGLAPRLMRVQFHEARAASNQVRVDRAIWKSPLDASKRGTITVIEPDAERCGPLEGLGQPAVTPA